MFKLHSFVLFVCVFVLTCYLFPEIILIIPGSCCFNVLMFLLDTHKQQEVVGSTSYFLRIFLKKMFF